MQTESLPGTFFQALDQQKADPFFGWAMYRLPGADEVFFAGGPTQQSTLAHRAQDGFAIAPFYSASGKAWHIGQQVNGLIEAADIPKVISYLPFHFLQGDNATGSTKTNYTALVQKTLDTIQSGGLQKAVPARTKLVLLPAGFSAPAMYTSLLKAYPNAFVYLLSTPYTGTWMGCTPELLLRLHEHNIETLSLAGTKKIQALNDGHDDFTTKESEEQAIVTRYVQNIIEKYCEAIQTRGPEKLQAGSIYHLATYFSGTLKSQFQGKYFDLIRALHPTPAVCGMPLNRSRDFLLQNENFDRALYSGFLGPVGPDKASIYVNLRCMQLFADRALLYAGAGVVPGSIPEKEWLETEEKLNTLLRFINP